MARGRGQIPPYGKNFRRESVPWTPEMANTIYVLKRDAAWFIRSDKTSKVWVIFYIDPELSVAIAIGKPLPSLTAAMARLLDGISQGFYQIAG